jgi:hypothetical protein
MESSLIPIDYMFKLDMLETYLEKYPEDVGKWIEHLGEKMELIHEKQLYRKPSEDDIPKNVLMPEIDSELPENVLVNPESGCIQCKRTWESTAIYPTTTLLCGHKYHTECYFWLSYHDHDRCIYDGCNYAIWEHMRDVERKRKTSKTDTTTVLLNAVRKTPDFKNDIKVFKSYITKVSSNIFLIDKAQKKIKSDLVERNLYNIQALQNDVNKSIKDAKTIPELSETKKIVNKFRKFERTFYHKYHLDLRDLMNHRLIKNMSWNVRRILQRHATLSPSKYRFRISIYPGSKSWV